MTDTECHQYRSAVAGTVVTVAGSSVIKPVLVGLMNLCGALLLLPCGGVMAYIGITEAKLPLLGLSLPFTLMCLVWAAQAVRRFRAAGDKQIYLSAGPDGVIIGMPDSGKIKNMVRLRYPMVFHEMTWQEIRNWYPHVIRVNGIPTERTLVFEGKEGWRLRVPLLYLAGSQEEIIARLSQAIGRSDLQE